MKTIGILMISGGLEVYLFAYIHLILEEILEKIEDNPY